MTLAWSAAGSLLILVAVAGWQWKTAVDAEHLAVKQLNRAVAAEASATEQKDIAHEQKDIAQTQRDLAVRNFGIAKQAADQVVFRIAQDLREVQGMRVEWVRRILDAAQGMMDELARAAPDDLPLQRSRAAMLSEFAITYRGAGDLTHARAAAEESLAIMRKLAAADPDNAEWQRDLSVSLDRLGDVRLAAGDQAAALAAYEESLAIGRKLAAADPGNAGWQRDLSISLDNVGDRRLGTGHRPAALAAYEESLAIRRKLAAADPGNTEWQAELVISLFKVSTAADPPRPRAALREAVAIAEGSRARASSPPRRKTGPSLSVTRSPSCHRRPPRRGEGRMAGCPRSLTQISGLRALPLNPRGRVQAREANQREGGAKFCERTLDPSCSPSASIPIQRILRPIGCGKDVAYCGLPDRAVDCGHGAKCLAF